MDPEPEAVTAGRAALVQPLRRYRNHTFHAQCPTPSCPVRHIAAQAVLAKSPDTTVGAAVDRMRCSTCGEAPEIVGLAWRDAATTDWLLLRNDAPGRRWR